LATWPQRPTLPELLTRIAGDIASRTEGRPFIRRTAERVLGFCMGGVAHGLHGHFGWVRDQLYPQSAEAEGLAEWADWLEEPRKAGSAAAGQARFTGAVVPSGTLAQSSSGALYKVGAQLASNIYAITAVDLGEAGNLAVNDPLSLVSPVIGVDTDGLVTGAVTGGAGVEDLELWRARVLVALRAAQLYGAPGDYVRWALKRDGVSLAWEVDRRMGAGTVSLAFVYGARQDVIPTPDDVASMQAFIDLVRPADMEAVYVVAPIRVALNFTVAARGTLTSTAVADALRDFFRTDVALEQPLSLSQIDEVISQVPGELSHTLTAVYKTVNGVTTQVASSGVIDPGSWGLFTYGDISLTVAP
jgi:uncharacterized phage protein gp47/JayE